MGRDFSFQKLLRKWIKRTGLRRIQEGEEMPGSQQIDLLKSEELESLSVWTWPEPARG